MAEGEVRGGSFDAAGIGELFAQFSASKLHDLDEELDAVGWWATSARLAHVRANRWAYCAVDPR